VRENLLASVEKNKFMFWTDSYTERLRRNLSNVSPGILTNLLVYYSISNENVVKTNLKNRMSTKTILK